MTAFWIVAGLILAVAAILIAAALFTRSIAGKVTRGFPPRGVFIETSAGRVHVVAQGSGPPIVMIHGLGGQIGNFSYGVMERLADRYRVIAIDRLGSGHSDPMPKDFKGVRRHAAIVAEIMEQMTLTPALIVGHSLGGAVALALAIDRPDQIAGLALIAPLTAVQHEPPAPFRGLKVRQLWMRRLMADTLAIPLSVKRRKATFDALFGPETAPEDFPTRGLGLLSLRPRAFVGASTDMVHANDDLPWMADRYPGITDPVAVLVSRQDRILDPAAHGQALVAAIPGATLTQIDGGHMIPVTAPASVAEFIGEVAGKVLAT